LAVAIVVVVTAGDIVVDYVVVMKVAKIRVRRTVKSLLLLLLLLLCHVMSPLAHNKLIDVVFVSMAVVKVSVIVVSNEDNKRFKVACKCFAQLVSAMQGLNYNLLN